jgi:hypothetical protein
MRVSTVNPMIVVAALVAGSGILAGGSALRPALANGSGPVNPFAIVHCNSGSPCETYSNKGVGAGLVGTNTNSSPFSSGLQGTSTKNGTGVSGYSNAGFGVTGGSSGATGVSGSSSTSWGVYGYSPSGVGVQGQSIDNEAVVAYSSNSNGVDAASGAGNGLVAIAGSGGRGIFAVGSFGDAIYGAAAATNGAVGLRATNDGDNGSDGNGADMEGSYIGVVARNKAGMGYPLVAADTNGTDLMFVDSAGDLFYHGGLFNFAKTRDGHIATTFGATTASPTIEDNGTAQLVGGQANVQLDAAFAQSIDIHKAYVVMLTPDGDTKGLFVASKSPTGFVVREVQGGHATISFDYHIYAPALGQAGHRMTEMTPAQAAAMMPKAQFTMPHVLKVKSPALLHHN